MKKKIAHNNITIFHSHENKTQKISLIICIIFKEGKNGGKSATRKEKKKNITTYIVKISCLQEITICLSEMMDMS